MLPFLQKIIDSKNKEETKRICDNETVINWMWGRFGDRCFFGWFYFFFVKKSISCKIRAECLCIMSPYCVSLPRLTEINYNELCGVNSHQNIMRHTLWIIHFEQYILDVRKEFEAKNIFYEMAFEVCHLPFLLLEPHKISLRLRPAHFNFWQTLFWPCE